MPVTRIFLSAGEASGDHYGARLIDALRPHLPQASFTGLGGTEMERAGLDRIVRAEDVAHMGITEVLRHAPFIFAQYRKLVRDIERHRPDAAILIDFPDVNFRLAKHLHRAGVAVIWLVSPQLWAWKRSRLRWVQQRVSKMLVIFPFEETFYRDRGVDATFIGHPLVEHEATNSPHLSFRSETEESAFRTTSELSSRPYPEPVEEEINRPAPPGPSTAESSSRPERSGVERPRYFGSQPNHESQPTQQPDGAATSTDRETYAAAHNLNPAKTWIALLPGSRWKEVAANLPALHELAVTDLITTHAAATTFDGHRLDLPTADTTRYEFLLPVASTIDRSKLEAFIAELDAESLRYFRDEPSAIRPTAAARPANPGPSPRITLVHGPEAAREALTHARASVVASGTATVLAAVVGNPFVVVYRVSALTFALARKLVRYPDEFPNMPDADGNPPIAMVNLIAGRRIVPELLQQHFSAANVATALSPLLGDTPERAAQIDALAAVRAKLRSPSAAGPIALAVEAVLQALAPAAHAPQAGEPASN